MFVRHQMPIFSRFPDQLPSRTLGWAIPISSSARSQLGLPFEINDSVSVTTQ